MKKSRKFKEWLGIVLVMALILIVPLAVVSCVTKPTPVVSATAVPSELPTQASTETPMDTTTAVLHNRDSPDSQRTRTASMHFPLGTDNNYRVSTGETILSQSRRWC